MPEPDVTHVFVGVAPCQCVRVCAMDRMDRKSKFIVDDMERRGLEVRRVPIGSDESVTRPCRHGEHG